MVGIHKKTVGETLVDLVYQTIEVKLGSEQRLSRLGASTIGEECPRAVWYSWRGFTNQPFEGRILRLFNTGHLQEDRIIADLRAAGAEVWDRDESTGEQFTLIDDTGHFVCKPDGIIRWNPHLREAGVLEVKTHGEKSFAELRKKGVEASKPEHVMQAHAGMWLLGMDYCLYVALNKNDEQYHIEVICRDAAIVDKIKRRIEATVPATIPPSRISENQSLFSCAWCQHKAVCAGVDKGLKNCRTCVNSVAGEDGLWICSLHGSVLDMDMQKAGCEDHDPY